MNKNPEGIQLYIVVQSLRDLWRTGDRPCISPNGIRGYSRLIPLGFAVADFF